MTYFGRAFELADGTIVLPCEFCGNPDSRPGTHTCEQSTQAFIEELERREVENL